MKRKNIVYTLVAIVTLIIISYSMGIWDTGNYEQQILKARAETDQFMRRSSESPLTDPQKRTFRGLEYFPPNQDYIVNAKLVPFQRKTTMTIPTSDNKEVTYIKYAMAEFTIDGTPQSLLLLQSEEENDPKALFLAFTDQTSGNETYGGGRYIDLRLNNDRRVIIDFNKAYSPFCMFNENYSCPFPPQENHLDVAILAGEKVYKE